MLKKKRYVVQFLERLKFMIDEEINEDREDHVEAKKYINKKYKQ